jgi:hypothetical protein
MPQAQATTRLKLDRAIQARIGQGLKHMYAGLAEAPVPDRLLSLLAKLDEKGRDTST